MLRTVIYTNKRAFSKVLTSTMPKGRTLANVLTELNKFAPLELAEPWDNVGLLIEPVRDPRLTEIQYSLPTIKRILLTNDLTESVMREVLEKQINMIISYHPPIFAPLKRITQANWKERIVSLCIANDIALFSPHTTWDAVKGGVNDWLASALPVTDLKVITPNSTKPELGGSGRTFQTTGGLTLGFAIAAVQQHIGHDVHVAIGVNQTHKSTISSVAVCAGSGGSVLKGVAADLYITGEMSHHELLEAQHQNTSVILCNHSNSERGYLHVFRNKLTEMLKNECEVLVSEEDKDPLITSLRE